MIAQKFVLMKRFEGEPKESDFQLQEETLPKLKNGEILVEAAYLSVDPYMRTFASRFPQGITMFGSQVGRIVQSKARLFPENRNIVGYFGWRTHTVVNPSKATYKGLPKPYLLEDLKELPISLALGVLGMPGNTAYFGLLDVCKVYEGETVAVSCAAGAVGSTVGQIARIKGCRVVGFAGSDSKVHWLRGDLGFDAAYNYKTKDMDVALDQAAPQGVDCYFDNSGGEVTAAVLRHIRDRGRVLVCGNISAYNTSHGDRHKRPYAHSSLASKELQIKDFSVFQWGNRWAEGINANLKWIREGKLKYRETITPGFLNMPKAFIGMLRGENIGKAIVKV